MMTPDQKTYQFLKKLDEAKTPYIGILIPFLSVISMLGELMHNAK